MAEEKVRREADLLLSQRGDAAVSIDDVCQERAANLTKADRNALAGLVDVLVQVWLER